MRPSLARLVLRAAGEKDPLPAEPLYTGRNCFPVRTVGGDAAHPETVTLAGNLCTAQDIAAEDIVLPRLEEGCLVVFGNAGAYAQVLSPKQFSFQEALEEYFLREDGTVFPDPE